MSLVSDYSFDMSGWAQLSIIMVLMNSCINPFIYAAKYRDFQRGIRRMWRRQVEPSVQRVEMQSRVTGR